MITTRSGCFTFTCEGASLQKIGTGSHLRLITLLQQHVCSVQARCLPALAPALEEHGPTVVALCRRLEAESAGLRELARRDAEEWGELYCGGMIEKSIRQVIAGGRDGVAR